MMTKTLYTSNKSDLITVTTANKHDDDTDDEEQMLVEELVLSVQRLSEVRSMCLTSYENLRIVARLQKQADRTHHEAVHLEHQCRLSDASHHSLDLSITRLKGMFHRERSIRYEHSSQDHARIAFKNLKTAYSIMNNSYGNRNSTPQNFTTTMGDYGKSFQFVRKRYHQSMKHVGAGRLPIFQNKNGGTTGNPYLGQIISSRQVKLLTAVITQIEDDLENLESSLFLVG